MKVRMKQAVGGEYTLGAGDVADVPNAHAESWIKAGLAEPVEKRPAPKAPETRGGK